MKVSVVGVDGDLNSTLSRSEKTLWITSFAIAAILCSIHVGTTCKRYFDLPISTSTKVYKSNTFKLPQFTICPLIASRVDEDVEIVDDQEFRQNGVRYRFTLFSKLARIVQRACEFVDGCTSENAFDYSLRKLNVSLIDVWLESRIDEAILPSDYCESSVNEVDCRRNFASGNSLTQVYSSLPTNLGGKCLEITQVDELIYNSFSNGFELLFNNQNQEQTSVLTIDFYDNLPLGMSCFSKVIEFNNVVVISNIKKFRYLNTETEPCVSNEEAVKCSKEKMRERLKTLNLCHLPMFEFTEYSKNCTSYDETVSNIDKYLKWFVKKLRINCVRSCEDTIVDFDVFESGFSATGNASIRIQLANNVVEEYIDEYAYGFATFLSDLAGIVGFCLGISLIHIINQPLVVFRNRFF